MGLYCGFSPEECGFPEQLEDEQYGIVVPVDYTEAARAFQETFLSYSRQIVPVDTGFLRSTLECNNDPHLIQAQTICEYAEYVEYGTWRQRAQPYFEPSIELAFEAFAAEATIAIEEAQEQLQAEVEAMQEEEEQEAMQEEEGIGAVNTGGIGAFLGSLIGALIVAFIIVTVQVLLGADFSSSSRGERGGGGSYGDIGGFSMPEVEII